MLSLFYLFLLVTKMDDDASFTWREGEEEMFGYIRQPAEGADDRRSEDDGTQFLNDSDQGMETERNNKYNEDSGFGGPPSSREVY